MTLLNDTEKVIFLINALERHIEKLSSEDIFANYLDSIRCFLNTNDPILQKAAFSNSELFIDNFFHILSNQISFKQAIGTLIAVLDKVGYVDPIDAAAVILEFEQLLKQMPLEETEKLYTVRWASDGYRG
ncbi:hypothetical protein [Paenibacillus sp. URB8-2]|uniref:hypothetical protein n=1 Tax=Paenibacillus sp. URB8-2 TaxID=2741301 RepID=UPI0015BFEEE9|nr:hypothetical protein [Paenibacillus sp. URB8-2]BCG60451.1 hypothetical protein PUR_38760 [Paenibacillus sp. URB8-2]